MSKKSVQMSTLVLLLIIAALFVLFQTEIFNYFTTQEEQTQSLPSQEHCKTVIESSTTNLVSTSLFLYGNDAQYGYIKTPYMPEGTETCTIIVDSDGPTFHHVGGEYFADKNNVYFMTVKDGTVFPQVVFGADATTFQKLTVQHVPYTTDTNLFFRDAKHLYYNGVRVYSINPNTFKQLWSTNHFLDSNISVPVGYYADGNAVYYFGSGSDFGQIVDADISSFHRLGSGYAKDAYRVYKGKEVISGADPKTFTPPQSPKVPCTEC